MNVFMLLLVSWFTVLSSVTIADEGRPPTPEEVSAVTEFGPALFGLFETKNGWFLLVLFLMGLCHH